MPCPINKHAPPKSVDSVSQSRDCVDRIWSVLELCWTLQNMTSNFLHSSPGLPTGQMSVAGSTQVSTDDVIVHIVPWTIIICYNLKLC